MKKSIIALSIACASAFAFADDPVTDYTQWQSPWFTGISNPTALNALGTNNATWAGTTLTEANAAIENGALVLDLDSGEAATINVGNEYEVETDAQNKITFTALLTPIAAGDLPTFESNAPQTGFALGYTVSGNETTYNYYAFNGTTWNTIGAALVSLPSEAVEVEINIEYWNATRKATFKVDGVALGSAIELAVASTVKNISSIDIKGSGTISALGGAFQKAVAKIGTQKYGTLGEAIEASDSAAGQADREVEVLLATAEPVTINNPYTVIKDPDGKANGKVTPGQDVTEIKVEVANDKDGNVIGASGAYVLKNKVAADDLDKVTVVLPSANKEVAGKELEGEFVKITIQTAASVIKGVTPEGGVEITDAGLAGVRTYLATYANDTYIAADVSSTSIRTALETTPTGSANNLKVWQLCAMGIEKETKLNPIANPAGQTESGKIKLSFPGIDKLKVNGDYTVGYFYQVGTDTPVAIDNPADFAIPTTPGIYSIKAVIGSSAN